MSLDSKNILIISPESWGKSKVSKHHYSLALADKGMKVYFLNLNVQDNDKSDEICIDHNNIVLTNIKIPPYVNKLRFHFRFLYNIIIAIIIKEWTIKHPKLDLLISFDCNGVFTDLSNFNAKRTFFFPVDQVDVKYRNEYKGFEELISISPVILRAFPKVKHKKLMHHGLSHFFSKIHHEFNTVLKPKKIVYVGNLLVGPVLDKEVLKKVIIDNEDLAFHFYGAYDSDKNNLGSNLTRETIDFVKFLKERKNCVLYGIVSPQELAEAYKETDAFLVIYNYKYDKNECSNSHKIMEYLSTGKPLISTRISMYDYEALFPMLNTFDNSSFPQFFKEQLGDWDSLNSKIIFEKRRSFALQNTYERKIDHIVELTGI
jgi:glycosyltransferase involved in cell wall biosynthesis